jgi:hypothetical protein
MTYRVPVIQEPRLIQKDDTNPTVLGKVAEELRNTYPSSVWASKTIPWLH